MGRTAPLTSKHCILYIYSTNIGTEYFKHALHSPFFFSSKYSLFHNANLFGSCIIHILYTGCAKIKKRYFRRQRVNIPRNIKMRSWCMFLHTIFFLSFTTSYLATTFLAFGCPVHIANVSSSVSCLETSTFFCVSLSVISGSRSGINEIFALLGF